MPLSLPLSLQSVRICGDGVWESFLAVEDLLPNLTHLELDECHTDAQLLSALGARLRDLRVLRFGCMDMHCVSSDVVDLSPLSQIRGLHELYTGYDTGFELSGLHDVLRACTQLRKLELPFVNDVILPPMPLLEEFIVWEIVVSRPFPVLNDGSMPCLKSLRLKELYLCDERGSSADMMEQNIAMLFSLSSSTVKLELGGRLLISSTRLSDAVDYEVVHVLEGHMGSLLRLPAIREIEELNADVSLDSLVHGIHAFERLRVLHYFDPNTILAIVQGLPSLAVLEFTFFVKYARCVWGLMCFVQGRGGGVLKLSMCLGRDDDAGVEACIQGLQDEFVRTFTGRRLVELNWGDDV